MKKLITFVPYCALVVSNDLFYFTPPVFKFGTYVHITNIFLLTLGVLLCYLRQTSNVVTNLVLEIFANVIPIQLQPKI